MSYDISFKVKVQDKDIYVPVGGEANITWNLREMIVATTGLEWKNEVNNGLVKDIIPCIRKGYHRLCNESKKFKQYESKNGWGTVIDCRLFFEKILRNWDYFKIDYEDLVDCTYFFIE